MKKITLTKILSLTTFVIINFFIYCTTLYANTSYKLGEVIYLSIGTGVIEGTYYPVGKALANLISHPPDLPPCKPDQACGVEGLVAVAHSTQGSLDNITGIANGKYESILCQSDIAYIAFHGKEIFAGREAMSNIRAIANLYNESIHIVASKQSKINAIHDLKGKNIAIGKRGSGTIINAKKILSYFDLDEKDFKSVRMIDLGTATELIRKNELDAFFMTAGYPVLAIEELAQEGLIKLVSIHKKDIQAIQTEYPFFNWHTLPEGIYKDIRNINLLTISALWLVDGSVNEELVYNITKSLWHPDNRTKLNQGHPQGLKIQYNSAQQNISIPFHKGALRFYSEQNKAKPIAEQH